MLTSRQQREAFQRRLEVQRVKARWLQSVTEAKIAENERQRMLEQEAAQGSCTRLTDVGNVQKTLKVSRVPLTGPPRALANIIASSPRAS